MRGSSEPRIAIQAAAGAMPKRQAEHQVRPAGESLGVGVKQEHREDHGREQEGLAVELRRGQDKGQRHNDGKAGDEASAK